MQLAACLLAAISAASAVNAAPVSTATDANPFLGKNYFANSYYAGALNQTVAAFLANNDQLNAARTRTVQKTGTFVWITSVSLLANINITIVEARAEQRKTKKPQIVELVLYNIPDRDCSGGQSGGEFDVAGNGLELYKHTFVDPFAQLLAGASDLTFAVIVEPDSLANVITNQDIPFCAAASAAYEEGVAYAIARLQSPNVALYVDAAHGGWLGWDSILPLAAAEFSKVVNLAQNFTSQQDPVPRIRGFSTDVSNYNPYIANPPASYTQYTRAYDELDYAKVLSPYLANYSLPTHFIIDQGRSGLQNTRSNWGEWCNVQAGFGIRPTTKTNTNYVDSIVWAKPGGQSDGACGPTIAGQTAPNAGSWWELYAEELVLNAVPPLAPTWK